jgi:hypothetical protein
VPADEPRSLHLHTLDSLVADLVSGRSIQVGPNKTFVLPDERTRGALEWYRKKGASGWTAGVSGQQGEDLVNTILQNPPILPALPARPANAVNRRLRLKKLEAHRFAGLHKFGTLDEAPPNYTHEFFAPLTLFEGRNGSGKTSLLNAIIWALTGEMLRAQREPEPAEDFECWVNAADKAEGPTEHKLSPLTPMPNVEQYRPDQAWFPADTWVELTFTDEAGVELPAVRRSQSRSAQGKLKEIAPDLSVLGIDPIALRVGTIMPGLLPLIRVGSESELGRAVSQLTGLSALINLAEHVRRAKTKIDKEFVKAKTEARASADRDYRIAVDDLERILAAHPSLRPVKATPQPSSEPGVGETLDEITEHFEAAKTHAFGSAREILGQRFDPANSALLSDLERNIGRALERASQPKTLPSIARLGALRRLSKEQLDDATARIRNILTEASTLSALAENPSTAARARLYARVATWIADHPDTQRDEEDCVVCGGSLKQAIDSVTGRPVIEHLHEAALDATLLSQTLARWAENAQGDLLRNLPEALRSEIAIELPAHPCDLLRAGIVNELFDFVPFRGVLSELKGQIAVSFDEVTKDRTAISAPTEILLPAGCVNLAATLKRLDCAIQFARWRQGNDELAHKIVAGVLGRSPKEGEPREKVTLTGKLLDLEATVKGARPISDALVQCERLKLQLKNRRVADSRLNDYAIASASLTNLGGLGALADQQVDQLRRILSKEAAEWRSRIYLGAFPGTAHELIDTGMGRKGQLDLLVHTGGVSAPAQHVTNASALRASLVAFFFAFWEYVLRERGGLTTLLLDDPQELLDDENRERLATALSRLVTSGAQLMVTSYDPRFSARVSRLPVTGGVEHFEVHPATQQQPVVRTTPPLPVIVQRKLRFEADINAEEPAREFADSCRVFFEAKLGDMFDDPAHTAWAMAYPDPTLSIFIQRLRPLVKANPQGMFGASVFRRFVDHAALLDSSAVLVLMNKSHHGRRQEIRAADVAQCANQLSELLELVEQMTEECYRWRRRDETKDQAALESPPAVVPMSCRVLDIMICPDLAAFTQNASSGESQETPERLDTRLFDNSAMYYLRRPNFGFAAPSGSLAIIEAVPGPAADRQLVIARRGSDVFARRLVRGLNASLIGLTAEVPDPRTKTPKTIMLPEGGAAIHPVLGIIFEHSVKVGLGQEEAVWVDASEELSRIEIAFRIVDDSAVPLALEKQIVLGGKSIELNELARRKDALVALTLDDGSSIFKRVGANLPGELTNLVQFESIGGLGSSQILSVGKPHKGFRSVISARAIIGVLYRS